MNNKKAECDHEWVSTSDHPGGVVYWRCKKCREQRDEVSE